jgi:hypothetical protein
LNVAATESFLRRKEKEMEGAGRYVTAREILVDARGRVQQGWCHGVDARDARGRRCAPWHPDARSWSVLGSLVASEGGDADVRAHASGAELGNAVSLLAEAVGSSSLQVWNDEPGRTQEEVLAAFDRALALLV